MADSQKTILLRNVEVNLKDKTNYSDLSALNGWTVSDEWAPQNLSTPYVVIVPGATGDRVSGIAVETCEFTVSVYIAERAAASVNGKRALLGVVSVKSGLDSLARFVRTALIRPSPYSDRKPGTPYAGSYTTQAGVLHAEHGGTEYLGYMEDEEAGEESGIQVIKVDVLYLLVDAK